MTAASMPGARRRFLLAIALLAFSLVVLLFMSGQTGRILVGDPAIYRERVADILDGGWPYRDVPFEHLPAMLVPMMAAWWLGGAASQSAYVVSFVALMSLTMVVTGWLIDLLGERFENARTGFGWLVITVPLLPLVLFRNDPFVVLLGVAALLLYVVGRNSWVLTASLGSLAKVWPATLALLPWPRRKLAAASVALSGIVALAISLVPGFVEGRDAGGIHAETVMGGLTGLLRTVLGSEIQLTVTTAAYLNVPGWVPILNALIGLTVFGLGVWAVGRTEDLTSQIVRLGGVVASVVLTSPLFSLQYVLWLTPFLALSRRRLAVPAGLALAVTTIALGWIWQPDVLTSPWFYVGVTVRNALFLAVALWLPKEPSLVPSPES